MSGKIESVFLNACRKNKDLVKANLLDGTSITGQILGFDERVIILSDNKSQILVNMTGILSIAPLTPVNYIFPERPNP